MHWSFRVRVPQPGPRCIDAATPPLCSSMDDAAEKGRKLVLPGLPEAVSLRYRNLRATSEQFRLLAVGVD